MRRLFKSRSKVNSKAGLGDAGASKASLSAASSKSNLAVGPEAGLGNPVGVCDPLVSKWKLMLIEIYRFRNKSSNLAKASGTGHTRTAKREKGHCRSLREDIDVGAEIEQTTSLGDEDTSKREKQCQRSLIRNLRQ